MIVIVAVAVYGAWLGFSMRPGLRAVAYAAVTVAAAQYVALAFSPILARQPGLEAIAIGVQAYAGSRLVDLAPTVSAAAVAATLGAILAAVTRSDEKRRRTRRIAAIDG
jgi:hypothetical protein